MSLRGPSLTADELRRLFELIETQGPNHEGLARAMRLSKNTIQGVCRRRRHEWQAAVAIYRARIATPPSDEVNVTAHGDAAEIEAVKSARIRTLEQLLAAAKVDLAQWEVERFVVNKWETARATDDNRMHVEELYQVKAWLRRQHVSQLIANMKADLLADVRASAREAAARASARPHGKTRAAAPALAIGAPHLLEIAVPDLHVGKLAWHEETGEDYDLHLAESAFREAVEDLLAKSKGFHVERIVFPIGNDLLQADNLEGTTTSGTKVDVDSRHMKAFRRARSLMSWALRRCAELAPVKGLVIPGNHDRLTAVHLGEVLAAEFGDHARVTIDNRVTLRKYECYGATLLGFTHGDQEKAASLPLIMAQEEPQAWARTMHREWHVGHLHKMKEDRYTAGDTLQGVRVRVIPSLSGTDAWHYAKGFVKAGRAAEAYLWNHATGYAGHFSFSLPASHPAPATGEPTTPRA